MKCVVHGGNRCSIWKIDEKIKVLETVRASTLFFIKRMRLGNKERNRREEEIGTNV